MEAMALIPLTPQSLESLLERLPASVRAELRWMPKTLGGALGRLLQEELTPELLGEVSTVLVGECTRLFGKLEALEPGAMTSASEAVGTQLVGVWEDLGKLPIQNRMQGVRALATVIGMTEVGFRAIESGAINVQEVMKEVLAELPSQGTPLVSLLDAQTLLAGTLMSIRQLGPAAPRTLELARRADDAAFLFATEMAALNPQDPNARLPWYFERKEFPEMAMIARWAEPAREANWQLLELLDRWRLEGTSEEDDAELHELKAALDADRVSSRPLFP